LSAWRGNRRRDPQVASTRHHGAIERSGAKPDGGRYDAVIVGASLSGCAAAIGLGRAGARVALVDKRPDPLAFKRMCSHLIQASAVPTLERLGLLEPMLDAGAVRTRLRSWTPWGWIVPPPERAGYGINLRRERLDPLVREAAAATPGVDLRLGLTAERLLMSAAARDPEVAARFDAFATRQVTPPRALATILPRALLFNARRVLPSHRRAFADR